MKNIPELTDEEIEEILREDYYKRDPFYAAVEQMGNMLTDEEKEAFE